MASHSMHAHRAKWVVGHIGHGSTRQLVQSVVAKRNLQMPREARKLEAMPAPSVKIGDVAIAGVQEAVQFSCRVMLVHIACQA